MKSADRDTERGEPRGARGIVELPKLGVRGEEVRDGRSSVREKDPIRAMHKSEGKPAPKGVASEGRAAGPCAICDGLPEEDVRRLRLCERAPDGEGEGPPTEGERAEGSDLPGVEGDVTQLSSADGDDEESGVSAWWSRFKHRKGMAALRGRRARAGRR